MADAEIILTDSRHNGIVALASGEKYPWAHTALRESGFQRGEAGIYYLPANESTASRTTVASLIRCAERHNTTVSVSSRQFIGDMANHVARLLPGQWDAQVEIYSHPLWQEDLVPWLWDSGELGRAVRTTRLPYAATLTNATTGTGLLLAERPGHQRDYLIGAFAPMPLEAGFADPHAPRSVVLPPSPGLAARAITERYLPTYDRAVHARSTDAVATALARLRSEHSTWTAMVASGQYSDATPLKFDALGSATEDLLDNAWRNFLAVLDHAPALLNRCRPATTPWPEDATALARLAGALADAEAVHEELASGVPLTRGERATRTWTPIETWLTHGETFLRQAHTCTPRVRNGLAPTATPRALPPGAPAPRR
ncbi:hypothetical protein Scani_78540 [Streptomyces caniferus]|uniref:Uncharacterized protein n=1 Tax=Streptomyces caniferus TaxID=285557 RepID=A0A640SN81_9ACTN|nr:hypothetical protein [Streptomyces caniferus]GFE11586.1 hypothetical protein Scani_78540 [Streptomyces caniferus]